MLKFFKEGIKQIMVNIEKMVDEIKNMTVSEAFPLVKALKDKFGKTWPPILVTNLTTADGEVKLDKETSTYTVGGTAGTFKIEPTAAPNTYSSVKLVQTAPDGTETEFVADAGLSEITVDVGTLENGLYLFHALTIDEFGNSQTNESPKIKVLIKNDAPNVSVIASWRDHKGERIRIVVRRKAISVEKGYRFQRATPVVTRIRFEVKRSREGTQWQSFFQVATSSSVLVPESRAEETGL